MIASKKNDGRERPSDWQARKKQILTEPTPSRVPSIAHAFVLKDEALFLVTERNGLIPQQQPHGFGAYHHDCRYLSSYDMTLFGNALELLGGYAHSGHEATFELANLDLTTPSGQQIGKHEIAIRLARSVDGRSLAFEDALLIHNYSRDQELEIALEFDFSADFKDIYIIRGLGPCIRGEELAPTWHAPKLSLSYRGMDQVLRSTNIVFSRVPEITSGARVQFRFRLPPRAEESLKIEFLLHEAVEGAPPPVARADVAGARQRIDEHTATFRNERAQIVTDDQVLNCILERSFADLLMLRTPQDGEVYFAAGVPWFTTLFGRDSLITALFVLPYYAKIAENTLRLLAKYQGRRVDTWRDEEPGKILHEFRVGELANLGEIPDTPYYGTIDATALFLILLARHATWTGSLELFRELHAHADAALGWITQYGERAPIEGYVSYQSESGDLLINQGWKDSGDAIVDENGQVVTPPIALVEVQAYTYLAKIEMAQLYERNGERAVADQLRREARELQIRFNRDFWMPDRQFYALALAANNDLVRVNASNPGHALFAGIVDVDKAQKSAERLMSEEMFSGWGVRTLGANEKGYNPVSYHRGTVWPHDNALIAGGLHRYGFHLEATRIAEGMIAAATHFPLYRLPEVFSGFPRAGYGTPIRYPVACHPQAWASGSIPFMVAALLGLEPDGFARRLRIAHPVLPPRIKTLELLGLALADACVDLRFERQHDGPVTVTVLRNAGNIEVVPIH